MIPMHPQPKQGELFSSWLVRLSLSNGLPLHSFYSGLLGCRQQVWTRDIDRHPSESFKELLYDSTKVSIVRINDLTLLRYQGIFYENLAMTGSVPWLLPVGVYHRTHKLAGIQFCPICLKHDDLPFYRLKWRIGLAVLCELHGCELKDRCPQCDSPVMFHRHGIGRGKYLDPKCLRLCHSCNYNLASVNPSYPEWPDQSSLSLLRRLARDFEECPWKDFPVDISCPIPLFTGLRMILSFLGGRFGRQVQSNICEQMFVEPLQSAGLSFEYLSTARRLQLLLCVCWIIDGWPQRFVRVCREAGMSRSRILERPDESPFWIESVPSNYLDNRTYSPSHKEFIQAMEYLRSQGRPFNCQNFVEVLGVQRDAARRLMKEFIPRG